MSLKTMKNEELYKLEIRRRSIHKVNAGEIWEDSLIHRFIDETRRPPETHLKENQNNIKQRERSKSAIAPHVWQQYYNIFWKVAQILHKEEHWRRQ